MVTEIELFEPGTLCSFNFYWSGWMKSELYKRKVDTWGVLLAYIMDAASCIRKCEDYLGHTTLDIHTQVANIRVDSGIFKHLLW